MKQLGEESTGSLDNDQPVQMILKVSREHAVHEDDLNFYETKTPDPHVIVAVTSAGPLRFGDVRKLKNGLRQLPNHAIAPVDERTISMEQVSKKFFEFGFRNEYSHELYGILKESKEQEDKSDQKTILLVFCDRSDPHKAHYEKFFTELFASAA